MPSIRFTSSFSILIYYLQNSCKIHGYGTFFPTHFNSSFLSCDYYVWTVLYKVKMVDPNFYIVAFNHVLDLNSRTQFLDKLSAAKLREGYHKQHSLTDKLESTFAELTSKSETCSDLSQEIQYHLKIAQKVRLFYCTIIFVIVVFAYQEF